MSEFDRLKKQYDALVDKEKSRERNLYDALKHISSYETSVQLNRNSKKWYGLPPAEAIEMAYDNVLAEAKAAIKGVRRP